MKNQLKKQIFLPGLLVFLCFCAFSHLSAMKRQQSRRFLTRASEGITKDLSIQRGRSFAKQSFTCPRMMSSKRFDFGHKTSFTRRSFSTTKPQLGFWQSIKYQFLSPEEKQKVLFDDLKKSIENDTSTEFPNQEVKEVIKNFARNGLINEKLGKFCTDQQYLQFEELTPLAIAIVESKNKPISYQYILVKTFDTNYANLHNQKALELAIKKENIGALVALQQVFTLEELYPYFIPVRETIEKIEKMEILGWPKIFKIYDILNQSYAPKQWSQKFYDPATKSDQEKYFLISTVEDLYNLMHNTTRKFNFNTRLHDQDQDQKNYSSSSMQSKASSAKDKTEEEVPLKYDDPEQQALYAMYKKIKRLSPEEVIGLSVNSPKGELKSEYFKLIRKYHPDRFYENKELRKMAEEVTKDINKAYKEMELK